MKFDDIHLVAGEKRSLFKFHFKRHQKMEEIEYFDSLYNDYHFIVQDYLERRNQHGAHVPSGTYSISLQYQRFKVYRREKRLASLPNWIAITISVLSLAVNVVFQLYIQGLFR